MKKGMADHVIMDPSTEAFKCLHCGDIYKPAIPCLLDVLVAMSRAFVHAHKNCKKPEEVTP